MERDGTLARRHRREPPGTHEESAPVSPPRAPRRRHEPGPAWVALEVDSWGRASSAPGGLSTAAAAAAEAAAAATAAWLSVRPHARRALAEAAASRFECDRRWAAARLAPAIEALDSATGRPAMHSTGAAAAAAGLLRLLREAAATTLRHQAFCDWRRDWPVAAPARRPRPLPPPEALKAELNGLVAVLAARAPRLVPPEPMERFMSPTTSGCWPIDCNPPKQFLQAPSTLAGAGGGRVGRLVSTARTTSSGVRPQLLPERSSHIASMFPTTGATESSRWCNHTVPNRLAQSVVARPFSALQ